MISLWLHIVSTSHGPLNFEKWFKKEFLAWLWPFPRIITRDLCQNSAKTIVRCTELCCSEHSSEHSSGNKCKLHTKLQHQNSIINSIHFSIQFPNSLFHAALNYCPVNKLHLVPLVSTFTLATPWMGGIPDENIGATVEPLIIKNPLRKGQPPYTGCALDSYPIAVKPLKDMDITITDLEAEVRPGPSPCHTPHWLMAVSCLV